MFWSGSIMDAFAETLTVGPLIKFECLAEKMGLDDAPRGAGSGGEAKWSLQTPQVILWVTGQTNGELQLEPGLDQVLRNGLKRIARSQLETWCMRAVLIASE